jgi:hypothetical protein
MLIVVCRSVRARAKAGSNPLKPPQTSADATKRFFLAGLW